MSDYIEPTFTKVEFEKRNEKPTFLLISAVGASGKSMLANKLSADTGLPILDLGKHPPVADNTLTGLLTTSYPLADLSAVFSGIREGTFGVIVDGIDEGRSKTNEKAFEAFLDDLVKLSRGSGRTSFVMLGRTKALDDCWIYLTIKGVSVGLASLDPFSLEKAREYIDHFADPPTSGQALNYAESRDRILSKLSDAFAEEGGKFLSFIGYPPVLDAIATLFRKEKNYYRLTAELDDGAGGEVEKNLLHRIASYILERERTEKVLPNLVHSLLVDLPQKERTEIRRAAFSLEEQCARLIAYCLGENLEVQVFVDPALNAMYESGVSIFLAEHPFIVGHEFRNAVFEAVSIAVLIASRREECVDLVNRYATGRKDNYHLIYLLDEIAPEQVLPSSMLHILIGSALELRSTKSLVNVTLEPTVEATDQWDDEESELLKIPISISLEVLTASSGQISRGFRFRSEVHGGSSVKLGSRLQSCFIDLPCGVLISGPEVELSAPVTIAANSILIQATTLIAKARASESNFGRAVILEADSASSTLVAISVEGADLSVHLSDISGQTFPLIKYVHKREETAFTGEMKEKYLKLRRIILHFRSHSKGSLAKYRDKVDNERVAGNEIGGKVLARLIRDEILYTSGNFYFLRPANVDKYLGIPWPALRAGLVCEKLEEYLRSI
jgi:hypothetical protein